MYVVNRKQNNQKTQIGTLGYSKMSDILTGVMIDVRKIKVANIRTSKLCPMPFKSRIECINLHLSIERFCHRL